MRAFIVVVAAAVAVRAVVVAVPFSDCSRSLSISTVYAQISDHFLNFTVLGVSSVQILDVSNVTNLLSTVFAPTSLLTFLINPDNESQFCSTLRPPDPLPALNASNYCPLQPGPFAFSLATPLSHSYELMTLNTRIRIVDTASPAQQIGCLDVAVTPLNPGHLNSPYGRAVIVFWISVALALAYWVVVGAGRLAAASKRGRQRVHARLWSRFQGLGFVLASAISGERFASSPALIRFGTPSMRDVIFHTQWCTILGMLTVQWPSFTYPYFAQTAWSTLLYNISFTQGSDPAKHWNPVHADPFKPPSAFASQLTDPTSPLFLNNSIPNTLFTLPLNSPPNGIPALAATVGIRPQDVFGISVGLFLVIAAGVIALSVFIGAADWAIGSLVHAAGSSVTSPPWSTANKELAGTPEPTRTDFDPGVGNVRFRSATRTLPTRTGWLNYRLGQTSFHYSVLLGNLVRVLILFHLPITIFSCFQLFTSTHDAPVQLALAALAFAIFSVLIPAWLVLRISTTPTSKLYDEMRTLLALGPLYNHYAHGSQLFAILFFTSNIAYGIVLGCGQQSGSTQAIVVLVVEVAGALTTSVWLPWGRGAGMGGVSFGFCVARIITAVLLVILSPIVSVGDDAAGWIAYAVLGIQSLVYVALTGMLLGKMAEGIVRVVWGVSFDRSKHVVDTGLFGTLGLVGAGTEGKRRTGAGTKVKVPRTLGLGQASESASAQTMLTQPRSHSHSAGVLRPEQLTQPYREDSDDEDGYILGAWHDDGGGDGAGDGDGDGDGDGETTPVSTTGFRRVAGGRAHIDAPYTMANADVDANSGTSGAPHVSRRPGQRRRGRGRWIDLFPFARGPAEERGTAEQGMEEPGSFVVIREREREQQEAPRSFSVVRAARGGT